VPEAAAARPEVLDALLRPRVLAQRAGVALEEIGTRVSPTRGAVVAHLATTRSTIGGGLKKTRATATRSSTNRGDQDRACRDDRLDDLVVVLEQPAYAYLDRQVDEARGAPWSTTAQELAERRPTGSA
jgi:hypothetical protein